MGIASPFFGSPFFLDFFFCSQLPISFRMRAGGRGGMRGEGVCRDGNSGRVSQGGSGSGGRGRDRTTVSLFQKLISSKVNKVVTERQSLFQREYRWTICSHTKGDT